ncbi:MAG: DUF4249 domain-containing protein [Ginsengibacter sp.]
MKWFPILFLPLFFLACEKDINFTLHEAPDLVVVDASIENGQPPIVILSNSFDYYSNITPALLSGIFIHDAEINISDGTETARLKEYSVDSSGGFHIFYYSTDSTGPSANFIGKINTNYSLQVIYKGKEYSASTFIPPLAKKIDSLWWQPAPFTSDSSKVMVFVRASDPPGLGNNIRYFTKLNSGSFLPGSQSVFDDQLIDGTTYDLRLDPGIDRNDPVPFDDNFFHHGDSVTLKLSNIDRDTYQFWLTMEFAYQSIGNPFASPNNVLGNISNGALGAFTGYSSSFKTLIIPK